MIFLHGLESGPHGTKYHALLTRGEVISPDFQSCPTLEERVVVAEAATRGMTNLCLVGSSFGGLLAAVMFQRYPERIGSYLLLAPALHRDEALEIKSAPWPALILHGNRDEIVPFSASLEFSKRFSIPLIEVDDDHRLSNSNPQMLQAFDILQKMTQQLTPRSSSQGVRSGT